jgi:excisionase family DNA binding protein
VSTPKLWVVLPDSDLLTPAEVARAFHVDPKTVIRWVKAGKIGSIRTPGGHRRYSHAEVDAFINGPEAGR